MGYWVSQNYRSCILKGTDSFPGYVRVYIDALLGGGELSGAHGFFNICALRNNIELSFGWVNAIVAIGHASFPVFIVATMLSIQPEIVLWVSIGRAVRAVGEKVNSGLEEESWEAFNEANLSVIYLCIIGSFMLRLGFGCIARSILSGASHRHDISFSRAHLS